MGQHALSVIVVTYNNAQSIRPCLESLFENPPSCDFEAIVVDNGSADETLTVLKEWESSITIIESAENGGFAAGNCLGAARAKGDLLLLLNPDTIVQPSAIDSLIADLTSDEEHWVAGPCLLTPAGDPAPCWGDFPTLGWVFAELAPWRRLGLPVRSRPIVGRTCAGISSAREVDWVTGAAFLVRRSVWDLLGGLFSGYFLYFEETDFCFQVHKGGGKVILVPRAQIVHDEASSVGQSSARQRIWSTSSLILFMRRNRGLMAALVTRCWIALVNLCLALLAMIAAPLSPRARSNLRRYYAMVSVAVGLKAGHPRSW